MEEKWNDLLGAVVGLVRTADREPADEETKRLVETALCRLLDGKPVCLDCVSRYDRFRV